MTKLQHILLADTAKTDWVSLWVSLFPKSRKDFYHHVTNFDIAFNWIKRFPEDKYLILNLMKTRDIIVPPSRMKEWLVYSD